MTGTTQRNRLRLRVVQLARAWKGLTPPLLKPLLVGALVLPILGTAIAILIVVGRRFMRQEAYREVFFADGKLLRLSAHHVLADLRDFTFAATSAFDPDPIIMARRQGRRDVWLRINRYLILDEAQVQTLMEIDDGI